MLSRYESVLRAEFTTDSPDESSIVGVAAQVTSQPVE